MNKKVHYSVVDVEEMFLSVCELSLPFPKVLFSLLNYQQKNVKWLIVRPSETVKIILKIIIVTYFERNYQIPYENTFLYNN